MVVIEQGKWLCLTEYACDLQKREAEGGIGVSHEIVAIVVREYCTRLL